MHSEPFSNLTYTGYRREPLLSNSPTRSGGDSLAGHRATMYAQFADRNSPSKYGNDLFSNIDKLFEDKIEYFGNFTMTRGGIHNVILKLFLKVHPIIQFSLFECNISRLRNNPISTDFHRRNPEADILEIRHCPNPY